VVDDSAISDADEFIDDLTDVGVPVVERILGGTVIGEESR
jgi:DNA polymerase-3 subunit gamma/tau